MLYNIFIKIERLETWWSVPTPLTEHLGVVLSTHISQLPTTCNSISGDLMPSGLCGLLHTCDAQKIHKYIQAHTFLKTIILKSQIWGAGEIILQLRTLVALPEDFGFNSQNSHGGSQPSVIPCLQIPVLWVWCPHLASMNTRRAYDI